MTTWFMNTPKALTGQAMDENSRKLSYRQISLCLSIFGAIIFWSYSGTLISSFTVPKNEPPFKTAMEFFHLPNFKLAVKDQTSVYGMFVASVDETEAELMRQKLDQSSITDFDREIFDEILQSESNSIGVAVKDSYFLRMIEKFELDYCDFQTQIMQDIPTLKDGWMFPYDSMLQPLFQKYMLQLYQDGIINRIENDNKVQVPKCNEGNNSMAINFGFVQILFYVLAFGTILSICLLFLEKMFKKSL